jgi:hypothetical protein
MVSVLSDKDVLICERILPKVGTCKVYVLLLLYDLIERRCSCAVEFVGLYDTLQVCYK